MLSALEKCVGKLEESMEDAKESGNTLGESIDDFREQSRGFVTMCLISQIDSVQELLDSQRKKLTERNNDFEAMMMALKEETMATTKALSTRIEELKRELALCQAAVGKEVSSAALSNEEVPKLKEFAGIRFTEEEAQAKLQEIMQRGTMGEYVQDFKELMLQVSDMS
ncbi:hypothetical protein Goshw_001222 [Gossypium schwendimanii]|uniref:Retrotransposon gag domain-containing protein n=1 Tax=Gossypium schwendimanii TaxID=34291 RepID=A0A7J9L094_GOSSC|nr:hypothetical protein [Gossypium schwendimanii]